MKNPDIDIDIRPDTDIRAIFPEAIRASNVVNAELRPHPCGYYFQSISIDPVTELAAVPYEEAENLGYLKIDFLHNHVYSHFQSHEEIEALLDLEPPWHLLRSPSIVKTLFQLGNHFDLVNQVKPTSIEELADVIALIRPGKREFAGAYVKNKAAIRPLLYLQSEDYSFKKSHASAYALVIVLQLHLIEAGEIEIPRVVQPSL